jgi:hypothetical protein
MKIKKTFETIRKSHARILELRAPCARPGHPAKRSRNARRKCNLCEQEFRAATLFSRFCETCREQNETFLFAEWLGARG